MLRDDYALMTTGTIIGRRRCCVLTQRPTVRRTTWLNACVSRVPFSAASASAAMIFGLTSSKTFSSSANPRDWISGPTTTRPVDGVDRDEDGDEALFAQDAAVFQVGVGDLADGRPVDVDVTEVELTDDLGDAVAEVDDDAVLDRGWCSRAGTPVRCARAAFA